MMANTFPVLLVRRLTSSFTSLSNVFFYDNKCVCIKIKSDMSVCFFINQCTGTLETCIIIR